MTTSNRPRLALWLRLRNSPLTNWLWKLQKTPEGWIKVVTLPRWLLCRAGLHGWRFASPKDIPGEGVSRASCQSCEIRKVTEPFKTVFRIVTEKGNPWRGSN